MAKRKNVENENVETDDIFEKLKKATKAPTLDTAGKVSYFIDTGNLALNYMCSGKFATGGIPGGRITEVYGPPATSKSLLGYCCLASCQRMGGITVLLDCERAGNAEFAEKAAHLNPKKLITYEPISIEQVEKQIISATKHIRSFYGKDIPILFVWDSISVSPTEREWSETELPENPTAAQIKAVGLERPGERARACGDLLRKINPFINENNATIYVINQIRSKIGVLYGCFQYDSRVVLADGSTMKIGKIVNQNMIGLEVMSFNPKNGNIEPKKIIKCHDNGNLQEDEKFLQFTVRKRGGNGRTQFACTPNHQIFVPYLKNFDEYKGYSWDNISSKEVSAGDLKIGDSVLVSQPYYLSEDQKQVVYGSILGDGEIRSQREDSCAQLRIDHGLEQTEYCQWKEEILNPWVAYSFNNDIKYNRVGFDTIPMYELIDLGKYKEDYCVPLEVMKNLSPLGLAIWYMDDGSYRSAEQWGNGQSVIYCIKYNNRTQLKEMLQDRFGLDCQEFNKGLKFNSENTKKLHEIIAPYIHPSMNYKLQHSFKNSFSYKISEPDSCFCYKAVPSEVVDIYEKPPTRSKKKFDITVEGNHSYIVDGAIVHNSPETTAGGGNGLPFYASCRLRTSIGKNIENKNGLPLGVNLKFANKKSRNCPPGMKTEGVQLFFESGINPLGGLLSVLVATGRVTGGKGNYTVIPEYTLDGNPIAFKSSAVRNDVPYDLLLSCPKLIDLETTEDVVSYFKHHMPAIELATGGAIVEKTINEDGDSIDGEDDLPTPDFIEELT